MVFFCFFFPSTTCVGEQHPCICPYPTPQLFRYKLLLLHYYFFVKNVPHAKGRTHYASIPEPREFKQNLNNTKKQTYFFVKRLSFFFFTCKFILCLSHTEKTRPKKFHFQFCTKFTVSSRNDVKFNKKNYSKIMQKNKKKLKMKD